MTNARIVKAEAILEAAAEQEITRSGLQALISTAQGDGEVDQDDALAAMRALLEILELAESAS